MRLLDDNFKNNKARYILQCSMAGVAMLVILAMLTSISNAGVIASLGASTFIVFALPHIKASRPRILIGGYAVAVIVGSLCFWLKYATPLPETFGLINHFPDTVLGAAAVGLTTFAMVITNAEHPPAAGLALGFVLLTKYHWETPVVVMTGIVVLCAVRRLLRPYLRNLI